MMDAAMASTVQFVTTSHHMDRIQLVQNSSGGLLWFAGWLFTIGYLKLAFWQGLWALFIWPYHIGVSIAALFAK